MLPLRQLQPFICAAGSHDSFRKHGTGQSQVRLPGAGWRGWTVFPWSSLYRVTKFKLIQRIFWNLVYAFHWVPFEFRTFGTITKHASPQSFAGLRHIFLNNSMLKIEQLDN